MTKTFRTTCNLLTALFCLLSLAGAWGMTRLGALHGNDFKHLWLGARMLAAGQNPYDPQALLNAAARSGLESINPFVYLPTTALALRPLADLSFGPAAVTWFWLNWALAWAIVLAGPSLLRVSRPELARLAGAAFLLGSLPFFRQQTAGQMNVVTAALILLAAAALLRRRDFLTGLVLALGFGWKIAPALLIAALAGLRRWRALAWGGAGCAALLLLSVAVYGWRINHEALLVTQQMGYGHSTWSAQGEDFYRQPFNQSINSLLHHLLTENPYTTPWIQSTPRLANGITMLASALLIFLWIMQAARHDWKFSNFKLKISNLDQNPQSAIPQSAIPHSVIPHSNIPHSAFRIPHSNIPHLQLFLAASLAMLLLPSLMWDHYAVQALPALLWIFGQPSVARSPGRAVLALAILAGLTIPIRHDSETWRHGAGILLMSLRLWPTLALYFWLLFDKRLSQKMQ